MASTLYKALQAEAITNKTWGIIVRTFGKDTEYEAIAKIMCDDETAQWEGFLIFKDYRFSPLENAEDFGELIQFQYTPSGAANGVLAEHRAKECWETLCGIFKGLKAS